MRYEYTEVHTNKYRHRHRHRYDKSTHADGDADVAADVAADVVVDAGADADAAVDVDRDLNKYRYGYLSKRHTQVYISTKALGLKCLYLPLTGRSEPRAGGRLAAGLKPARAHGRELHGSTLNVVGDADSTRS